MKELERQEEEERERRRARKREKRLKEKMEKQGNNAQEASTVVEQTEDIAAMMGYVRIFALRGLTLTRFGGFGSKKH